MQNGSSAVKAKIADSTDAESSFIARPHEVDGEKLTDQELKDMFGISAHLFANRSTTKRNSARVRATAIL